MVEVLFPKNVPREFPEFPSGFCSAVSWGKLGPGALYYVPYGGSQQGPLAFHSVCKRIFSWPLIKLEPTTCHKKGVPNYLKFHSF
jgi:hypothetical protein